MHSHFVAFHQQVDHGCIFSCFVIAAEEIVLASQNHGMNTILYENKKNFWITSECAVRLAKTKQKVTGLFRYIC